MRQLRSRKRFCGRSITHMDSRVTDALSPRPCTLTQNPRVTLVSTCTVPAPVPLQARLSSWGGCKLRGLRSAENNGMLSCRHSVGTVLSAPFVILAGAISCVAVVVYASQLSRPGANLAPFSGPLCVGCQHHFCCLEAQLLNVMHLALPSIASSCYGAFWSRSAMLPAVRGFGAGFGPGAARRAVADDRHRRQGGQSPDALVRPAVLSVAAPRGRTDADACSGLRVPRKRHLLIVSRVAPLYTLPRKRSE